MLRPLLKRAAHPGLFSARDDVVEVLKSLTRLRQAVAPKDLRTTHAIAAVMVRLGRHDVSVFADVLKSVRLDPRDPLHGRSASLWALCMPKADVDEADWDLAVGLFEAGIGGGCWHAQEVRGVLAQVSYWGVYPPTLPHTVERYVAARLALGEGASGKGGISAAAIREVPHLAAILALLPENRASSMLTSVAERAAGVAEDLSPAEIGLLCGSLAKIGFMNAALLIALQEESVRFAEACDAAAAVHYIAYVLLHDTSAASPENVARAAGNEAAAAQRAMHELDAAGFSCVVESLVVASEAACDAAQDDATTMRLMDDKPGPAGEVMPPVVSILSLDQLIVLLKALRSLPRERRVALLPQLKPLVDVVSREIYALFARSRVHESEKKRLEADQADPIRRKRRASIPSGLENGAVPGGPVLSLEAPDELQGITSRYIGLVRSIYPAAGAGAESQEASPVVQDDAKKRPEEPVQPAEMPALIRHSIDMISLYIKDNAEALVSAESPPFGLIPNLFQAEVPLSSEAALALLTESAAQGVHYPALQAFQYLLQLGDRELFERRALRHLRHQFATSAAGIPMVQLCAALKVFGRGARAIEAQLASGGRQLTVDEEVELEEEAEQLTAFLQFCDETISRALSNGSIDMTCSLAATESLYNLGYREQAFYARISIYINAKADHASPEIHDADTAEVVQKALEQHLEGSPKMRVFLEQIIEEGTRGDAKLKPSLWMNRNDPANYITPLTEQQEAGWAILHAMDATRADDEAALGKLASDYIKIINDQRVDDIKFFFALFADKVYKNDKLMKEALEHLLRTGSVTKLAGTSISAMLHSLTCVRFSHYKILKEFLLGVSEEQWGQLDAATVAAIIQSMGKLSIRLPAVLVHLGERLVTVYKLLTPLDTAVVLAGLQALGYSDEAVLALLMQHVAANAYRFDEAALAVLWSSPNVHRLLVAEAAAAPLLAQTVAAMPPSLALQQKIVAAVRKSSLPRETIQESVRRLAAAAGPGVAAPGLGIGGGIGAIIPRIGDQRAPLLPAHDPNAIPADSTQQSSEGRIQE